MPENLSVVGRRMPRIDAEAKVRGSAVYVADLNLPGMLCGKILRSPYPHARIVQINVAKAQRLPGVRAIITGRDAAGKTWGPLRFREKFMDEPPLAWDKVRYVGEGVAAVAAVDEDTALEALDLIEVEYDILDAVFTTDEALRDDAPLLHEDRPNNISRAINFEFGDVETAFAKSYHVREDVFETSSQSHVPLEPHGCVAWYESGKLTLWTATQSPYFVKSDLARTLEIPESNIRVIVPFVGGGFGGKADGMFPVDFCASLLSMKSGKPVKIIYSREEEFIACRRRHPAKIYLKTGVTRDGTITGRLARVVLDGGAYNGWGPATILLCGIYLNLPYRYQAFKYEGIRVYTNNPVSSAMRGHGAPQVQFASDVQLDMIAEDINLDPVEIRLKNALASGEKTLNGLEILSSGLRDCIEQVVSKSGWYEKRGRLPRGRGIGIACAGFSSGQGYRIRPDIPVYSSAIVKLNEDGSILVLSGAADTGQGSDTLLVQIAAETIGVEPDQIKYVRADTDVTPADLGSFSSRETVFAGNAVKHAAEQVKAQVLEFAAQLLEANPFDLQIKAGEICVAGSPGRKLDFKEAARKLIESRGGRAVVGEGSYEPRDKLNYQTYSFGAQVTELTVNERTGEIAIEKVWSAHDSGRPINPMAVEGQLEGSVHMGLGFALSEQLVFKEGMCLNPSTLTYYIPTSIDVPDISPIHVHSDDPEGPFGAKEAGEGTLGPVAPSVANAIYDAVGIRMKQLPVQVSGKPS